MHEGTKREDHESPGPQAREQAPARAGSLQGALRGLAYADQVQLLTPGDGGHGARARAGSVQRESSDAQAAAPTTRKDKGEAGKAREMGPVGLAFKGGTDGGTGELSGKYKPSLPTIPIFTGVFLEPTLSLTGKGTATLKPDGSFEGKVAFELEGRLTVNGGIPKVGSLFGGAAVVTKVTGVKVVYDHPRGWSLDGFAASLIGKLVLGAKAEKALAGKPDGWKATGKLEWSPGGELELLELRYLLGGFDLRMGKDMAYIVEALDSLCSWAGVLNPFDDGAVRDRIALGEHRKASTDERIAMIRTLLGGACLKDDEQAIITVLDVSSERGDVDKVVAAVGPALLLDKVNDDLEAKAKLQRYLKKPEDASGPRAGRFSVQYKAKARLSAKSGAVKLERGSVWLHSAGMLERLRALAVYMPDTARTVAAADTNGGWIEAHPRTRAVAAEQNNELGYTLFFNSEAEAKAEVKISPLTDASLNAF